MKNFWFQSDSHWEHAKIIQYVNRPFSSVEEMNEKLIENWNKVVQQYDEVYMLGDVAFCKYDQIIKIMKRLNGIKHLLLGNHDHHIVNHKKEFEDEKIFNTMDDYKEVSINKQKIIMSHYPFRSWNGMHHKNPSWMLHGHCHNSMEPLGKSVDVGVDSTYITGKAEYRPFHFDEIKRFMDKQPILKHFEK